VLLAALVDLARSAPRSESKAMHLLVGLGLHESAWMDWREK